MKKLILGIFILLISLSAVFAADQITVQNSVTSVLRGNSAQGTITIRNSGTTNLQSITFITSPLVALGNPANTLPAPAFLPINLDAGQSQNLIFNVVTDQNTPIDTYTSTMTTIFNATSTAISTITVNVQGPSYGIQDISAATLPETSPNSQVSTSFTVRNTGNSPITNIRFTSNADSKYALQFTPSTITSIAGGQAQSVSVTATIPSGEATGSRKISDITVIADQAQKTFELDENVKSMLEISQVDAYVDGKSDDEIGNGDTISEDAKPGSKVTFEVTSHNKYSSSSDISIKNIEVTVTIKGIDDGDDIDEKSKTFTLSADDDKKVSVDFNIPMEVDEDNFKVTIDAEGRDENRITQKDTYTVYLNVNKKTHDVRINSAEVVPTSALCGEEIRIPVELINLGADSEDNVRIEVKNADLKINDFIQNIQLSDNPFDSDSKFRKTFAYDIPTDAVEKQEGIDVKVYYNNNVYSDQKRLVLDVKCPRSTTTTTTTIRPTTTTTTTLAKNNTQNNTDAWNNGDGQSIDGSSSFSLANVKDNIANFFSSKNGQRGLLIALDILVMIAVILGIIVYMKRKKEKDE